MVDSNPYEPHRADHNIGVREAIKVEISSVCAPDKLRHTTGVNGRPNWQDLSA